MKETKPGKYEPHPAHGFKKKEIPWWVYVAAGCAIGFALVFIYALGRYS